jgi:anti-anti-sigma factor
VPFEAIHDRGGEYRVVRLTGELDIAARPSADRVLAMAIHAGDPSVLVDVRDLTFLDSSGLAVLMRAKLAAEGNGIRFALSQARPTVMGLLRITKMDGLFSFVALEDEPISA